MNQIYVTWCYILKSNIRSLFKNIKSEMIKHCGENFHFELLLKKSSLQNDIFIFPIFHCKRNCKIKMNCGGCSRIFVNNFES